MAITPQAHMIQGGKQFISLRSATSPSMKLRAATMDEHGIPLKRYQSKQRDSFRLNAFVSKRSAAPPNRRDREQEDAAYKDIPVFFSGGKVRHSWPLDADAEQYISSPFGMRNHPITGRHAFHAGLDIAAPTGTSVLASAAGTVEEVGRHVNLGRFVKVRHRDDSYSLYGHLSDIAVREGERVRQREKVGEVGNTGRSTGPHLDYSLRVAGKPVDPEDHLPPLPAKRRQYAMAR